MTRIALLRGLVFSWLVVASVEAATLPAEKKAATRPAGPVTPRSMLAEGAAQLDQDVAARMLKRPDTAAADLPRLELEIDLRIIQRWVLGQALEVKGDTDVHAAACMRWQLLYEATAAVEEAVKPGGPLSATQQDGANRLHQLTFSLPELKTVREFDELSRNVGAALASIAAAQPIDPKSLPAMRPKMSRPARPDAPDKPERPTAAQLADQAKRMNLSPGLRQQILNFAKAAQGAPPKDAGAMYDVLSLAVELAEGLSGNTAVAPDQRMRIESQLTEGLALWLDPRTRGMGQSRIDGLQQYRQTLSHIGRLNLPENLRAQLSPVFAWASQNGEAGTRTMVAIDRFGQLRTRNEARERKQSGTLPLRKPMADLEKSFDQAAGAFPTAALELGKPSSPTTPNDLASKLDEMQRCLDMLDKLDQMPRVLDQLGAYKPRPGGGLERRVGQLAAAIAAPGPGPARNDAVRALDDLAQLSRIAGDLASIPTREIPADVDKAWAGGQLAAADAKWRTVVGDLASQAAGGGDIDRAKMARLGAVGELLGALRQAAALDAAMQMSPILARWIDWRVPPETLKALFVPYQEAMGDAFASLAKTGDVNAAGWARARDHYRPIMVVVNDSAGYKDQCSTLPTGLTAALAGLMTPLDSAPFAAQRRTSLWLSIWGRCTAADDETGAAEALDALSKRLAKDLRLD